MPRVIGKDPSANTECRHCAPACPLCVMKDSWRRMRNFGVERELQVAKALQDHTVEFAKTEADNHCPDEYRE